MNFFINSNFWIKVIVFYRRYDLILRVSYFCSYFYEQILVTLIFLLITYFLALYSFQGALPSVDFWLIQISVFTVLCIVQVSTADLLLYSVNIVMSTSRFFLFYSKRWWRLRDSNSWPPACKAGALPTELNPHNFSWQLIDDSRQLPVCSFLSKSSEFFIQSPYLTT
jgi:hypothetical protein